MTLPSCRVVVLSALASAALIGSLLGGLYLAGDALFRHDPDFRRWYNVLRSKPFRYEGIRPIYLETDPASLIHVDGDLAIARRRLALSRVIFGTDTPPDTVRPDTIERAINPAGVPGLEPYAGFASASAIDRFSLTVDEGFTSRFYLMHPKAPNGRLVVYHQGYAATIAKGADLIRPLLERGFTVLALNYVVPRGENILVKRLYPGYGVFEPGHEHLAFDPLPLRRYFLPVLAGLNQALADTGASWADMAGISAGGWVSVVLAALEPRIRRSYPMAGAYPLYLQQLDDHPPAEEQYYPPLLHAANYMDMFVMGAVGPDRGQIQFFGQYDRCCQNNRLAELYAPAVTAAVERLGGRFAMHLNTTSPDHRINEDYVEAILADLAQPPAPVPAVGRQEEAPGSPPRLTTPAEP
ncbi:alpha/beta hydrolase [Pararhodospirillum oryzae]|uniref:Alpha/beta hydrolase n=1 Tax=Pararhodospirillum oryzae TaxID=478448 RepID=A0A512H9A2_9PROT|nr:alpha/beta hydrolase [Pararhodospirillum oryzae]GEO82036.1 alpha/beta hydrolase [Pararhodospirillum oryzae]